VLRANKVVPGYNTSMATGTLLSLTEFTHLPDEPGKQELSNGELIVVPPPKYVHQKLSRRIYNALHAYLEKAGSGEVWAEAGFQLSPTTIRQPDVAVVLDHRGAADDEWLQGAPDIAIEVLSPANSAEDMELKISQYLASGARSMWIVSPKAKQVRIYRADGTHELLGESQVLSCESILPGFALPLDSLFA
jgi:Uma2 family endonuclease